MGGFASFLSVLSMLYIHAFPCIFQGEQRGRGGVRVCGWVVGSTLSLIPGIVHSVIIVSTNTTMNIYTNCHIASQLHISCYASVKYVGETSNTQWMYRQYIHSPIHYL